MENHAAALLKALRKIRAMREDGYAFDTHGYTKAVEDACDEAIARAENETTIDEALARDEMLAREERAIARVERDQDAPLLTAAPALLEALRGVLEPLRMGMRHVHHEDARRQWQERLDAALTAIAQAEPDPITEEIENEKELTRVDREIAEERYRDELERR